MTYLELFNKCLYADYKTVEETQGDYCVEKEQDTLYIMLQGSNQREDWFHNFDFPAKPYHDMPVTWRAHRGFVKVWKSIIPYIKDYVQESTVKSIIVIGYSHGAALACLAQEYIWFNRPDIRDNCWSYAFESPRVFCGIRIPKSIKERWDHLIVFRNGHDIVTHVPPLLFGFKHVGTMIKIGQSRKNVLPIPYMDHWYIPKCLKEHYEVNVQNSLKEIN